MDSNRRKMLCAMLATPFGTVVSSATAKNAANQTISSPSLSSISSKVPDGASPAVDIVADLPHKAGYTLNSWFAIGHFESEGHNLSYLVHLFALSKFGVTFAVDSAASITDETTGAYIVEHNFHTILRASAASDELLVRTPRSEITGTLDNMRIRANVKNCSIDIRLNAVGHPIYNKGTGRFDMLGMDVFQYSIPTLDTTGHITIDGKKHSVSGTSWFDRQWQNQPLGPPEGRWTWMDLNLSNGWRVSLWDAVDANASPIGWVTVIDEKGRHTLADLAPIAKHATDFWESAETGYRYPTQWLLNVPSLGMQLEVLSWPQGQEVVGLSPRYEGASLIKGTINGEQVRGRCYVEMVGNWS